MEHGKDFSCCGQPEKGVSLQRSWPRRCPEAHAPHLSSVEICGRPLSPSVGKSSSWTRFLQPTWELPLCLLTSPSKACLSVRLPSGRFSHINRHHARLHLALNVSHSSYTGEVRMPGTWRRSLPSCAGDHHGQHREESRAGLPALSSSADASA